MFWYREIRCSHTSNWIESSSRNFSFVIYIFGCFKRGRKSGLFQVIEILHSTVFPNKCAAIPIRVTGESYHFALLVDSIGFAVNITGKKTERLHSIFDCPNERLEKGAIRVVRRTGETDDVALLIDCRRRIPKKSPRLPRSVTPPFSQSTACAAVYLPTAWSQIPEMPTIWPLSLIAVAAPEESPEISGRSFITSGGPRVHTAGRNCDTCGETHVGS